MKSVIFGIRISFISLIIFFLPSCKDSMEDVNNQRINNMSEEDIRNRALLAFEKIRSFEIELGECDTPKDRQELCDKMKHWMNNPTLDIDCLAWYGYSSAGMDLWLKQWSPFRQGKINSHQKNQIDFPDPRYLKTVTQGAEAKKNKEEIVTIFKEFNQKFDAPEMPEDPSLDAYTPDQLSNFKSKVVALSDVERNQIRSEIHSKIKDFFAEVPYFDKNSGDGLSEDHPIILSTSRMTPLVETMAALNVYARNVLGAGLSNPAQFICGTSKNGLFEMNFGAVRLKDGKKFLLFIQQKTREE